MVERYGTSERVGEVEVSGDPVDGHALNATHTGNDGGGSALSAGSEGCLEDLESILGHKVDFLETKKLLSIKLEQTQVD